MIDALQRRRSVYLYLQDLLSGASVLELGDGDAAALGAAGAKRIEVKRGAGELAALSGSFDVVLALETAPSELEAVVAEAARLVGAEGTLVVSGPSRDRPGATGGFSYYDLMDRLEPRFAEVKMIGQAPFFGATLVEYGVPDPEPVLDGRLVEKGERVEWYLAVAGPKRGRTRGYGVVQLPLAPPVAEKPVEKPRDAALEELREALRLHAAEMTRKQAELEERDACIVELERDRREGERLRAHAGEATRRADAAERKERETRRQLAEAEGKLLRQNAAPTAAPVVVGDAQAAARIAELEAELEKQKEKEKDARADAWKALKARSEAEAAAADVREDTVRKLKDARKLASVELMRAMEEATKKNVTLKEELVRAERERKELLVEVKSLRAELEALKPAHEALRGEAETLRAEHARTVELARAREEGDAAARAARAQAERSVHDEEAARAAAEAAERAAEAHADALRGRVQALERELAEATVLAEAERERAARFGDVVRQLESAQNAQVANDAASEAARAEHERLGRMLAEVELDAKRHAEVSLRTRQQLAQREHEVEALRAQLERVAELELELQRRDAAVERAAAAAAHERARAERLVAEERRAILDRNEARARVADAEAHAAALTAERERLQAQLAEEAERAHKAENEARERKERGKQLKRDLEDAERRVAQALERAERVEAVRQRMDGVERALGAEAQRLAQLEEALRHAAAEATAHASAGGGAPPSEVP
jgi:hypothetical protein